MSDDRETVLVAMPRWFADQMRAAWPSLNANPVRLAALEAVTEAARAWQDSQDEAIRIVRDEPRSAAAYYAETAKRAHALAALRAALDALEDQL